jgi:hypothetical protein
MTKLLWDSTGEHFYEIGIDRGVLYPPSGAAVPWNGITSVDEDFGDWTSDPVYFDGAKLIQFPGFGDFAGTLTAFTYPDEFVPFEGTTVVKTGVQLDNQNHKSFGLSYRTRIGNDVSGENLGYKIHILYNLTAALSDTTFESQSDSASAIDFSWNLTSRPETPPGYLPTAHVIIDSRYIDATMLSNLEDILYGSAGGSASLPSLSSLISTVTASGSAIIVITDGGDGTWTATASSTYLTMLDATTFQITGITATFLDVNTYTASTT